MPPAAGGGGAGKRSECLLLLIVGNQPAVLLESFGESEQLMPLVFSTSSVIEVLISPEPPLTGKSLVS